MQLVCFYKWKQMVPWQRSHSHLLNNDDKRRNKQNLSKKINVDSQRFSLSNEKRALTPSISALLNGSQHSTSLRPTRTFFLQVTKTPFTGAACLIHPLPSHLPVYMGIATPKPEGRSIGMEWNIQIHPRPGPPTPPLPAATATRFRGIKHIPICCCRMRHWIIKSSQDGSCLLPIGVLKKINTDFKYSSVQNHNSSQR